MSQTISENGCSTAASLLCKTKLKIATGSEELKFKKNHVIESLKLDFVSLFLLSVLFSPESTI